MMEEHSINYKNLNCLALIRFGHRIGHGWYRILVKAEKELSKFGVSIERVERKQGILILTTDLKSNECLSQVQNILYESELASEMTCEWCGNYSVSQIAIDKELFTICEGCQEKCESLEGVEKRLRMNNSHNLEQVIGRMNREIQRLEYQVEYFKMGCTHYKKRSEKLSKKLERGPSENHKKRIRVVTSKEKTFNRGNYDEKETEY